MQNQPPVQVSSQPPAVTKSSTGLDENLAALLSYLFTWVSGLIFFLIEKDSRLVRFHAMQSILLSAAAIVVGIVLWIAWIVVAIVMGLVLFVFYIAILIGFILCMVKAYQKQYFKLPVIGNFAEKFSTK
jgi:uncharacterized membrane protein